MSGGILQLRGIVKEFPGVRALDGVSFSVRKREIHALVGENGAGKSTLMKVVSGVYPHGGYQGEFLIDDNVCRFRGIRESEAAGVAIIYQELALVGQMTVCENILLGQEIAKGGVIEMDQSRSVAERVLKLVGLDVSPFTEVRSSGRLSCPASTTA